jgi:hypothetical protein
MSGLEKAVDAAGRGVNRLQIGCMTIFFNLFFAAFCMWGVYAGYISLKLQTEGQVTTGRVVEMEESDSGEGGCCVYSPVIEFEADNQTYSFDGGNASDPPAYRVGQEVRVRYDPANPNTAQIDSFFERWVFPIIIIPVMIIAALVLNFFMFRAWRKGEAIMDE